MADQTTLEKRLAKVEHELAALKSRVQSLSGPKDHWIDAIRGTFKDDPEFDEILRLGKEIRDADKPPEE